MQFREVYLEFLETAFLYRMYPRNIISDLA